MHLPHLSRIVQSLHTRRVGKYGALCLLLRREGGNKMHAARLMKANRIKVLLVVVAVMLATVVLTLAATQKLAQAAIPGQNGKIAFVSYLAQGGSAIFTIDPADPVDDQATLLAEKAADPAFSPDGQMIVFVRKGQEPRSNLEVWAMDADGANQVQLTNTQGYNVSPAWFPSGNKIAIQSNRKGGIGDIYVLTLNRARNHVVGVKRLTNNRSYEDSLAVSP